MNKKVFGGIGIAFVALFIIYSTKIGQQNTAYAIIFLALSLYFAVTKLFKADSILTEIQNNVMNFRKERSKKL